MYAAHFIKKTAKRLFAIKRDMPWKSLEVLDHWYKYNERYDNIYLLKR